MLRLGSFPKTTQYLLGHVQKLVQVRSAVGELAEGTLPLHMIFQLTKKIKDDIIYFVQEAKTPTEKRNHKHPPSKIIPGTGHQEFNITRSAKEYSTYSSLFRDDDSKDVDDFRRFS